MNKKAALIFGSYNGGSVGDTVILFSLINSLLNVGFDKLVILSFPSMELEEEIKQKFKGRNISVVNFLSQKSRLSTILRKLPVLKWIVILSDMFDLHPLLCHIKHELNGFTPVGIIGGGNLLMDLFPRWPIYFLRSVIIMKLLRIRFVIASVGALPLKRLWAIWIFRISCWFADKVTVRDKVSLQSVRDILHCKKSIYMPDFAFCSSKTIRNNHISLRNKKDIVLGLNVSGWVPRNVAHSHEMVLKSYLNWIFKEIESSSLLPMCNRIVLFTTNRSDVTATKALFDILNMHLSDVKIDNFLFPCTADDLNFLMSSLDLVVFTRLHAGIIALRQFVPVIGIVYQPKVWNVLTSIGLTDSCVQIFKKGNLAHKLDLSIQNQSNFTVECKKLRQAELMNHSFLKHLNL